MEIDSVYYSNQKIINCLETRIVVYASFVKQKKIMFIYLYHVSICHIFGKKVTELFKKVNFEINISIKGKRHGLNKLA